MPKGIEAVVCLRSTVMSQHWIYPWLVVRKWTPLRVVQLCNLGTNSLLHLYIHAHLCESWLTVAHFS